MGGGGAGAFGSPAPNGPGSGWLGFKFGRVPKITLLVQSARLTEKVYFPCC